MSDHRVRKGVPLYDVRGKFLRYIDHASGEALTRSGDAEAVRKFQGGSEHVTSYRETRETKSPVRGSTSSLFS